MSFFPECSVFCEELQSGKMADFGAFFCGILPTREAAVTLGPGSRIEVTHG
jgi:hypothetical protein